MINRLIEKLQIYCDHVDNCNKYTALIINAAKLEKWDVIEELIENRSRIILVISNEQERVEAFINSLIDEELTPENINLIKSWAFDTQKWINDTAYIDNCIVELLNQSKDHVTQEIATVFKSKQAFRGYSLNDVSK